MATFELTAPPETPPTEEELRARFDPERIGQLAEEFLAAGTPHNLKEMAGERQFVVAYIPANSPYADIPRSVETTVFAKAFDQTLTEVVEDYGKYDPVSTFATVIDVSTPVPRAAAALRICEYDPKLGFKDVNDLVSDPESPWLDEIKENYFAPGEAYDPATAWKRMGEKACGHELKLDDSLDIATHSSAEEYQGEHGDLNGPSMLFYHACLRYAFATNKRNLLAIFDLKPLANLQQFGEPFELYPDLKPHPYGGPGDTLPAFCRVEKGTQIRISNVNKIAADVLIYGANLETIGLLPNEYESEKYGNQVVNL